MNDQDWTTLIEAGEDPELQPRSDFVDGLETRLRGMTDELYGGRAAPRPNPETGMKNLAIAATIFVVLGGAVLGMLHLSKRPANEPVETTDAGEGSGSAATPIKVDPRILEMIRKQKERRAAGSGAPTVEENKLALQARFGVFAPVTAGPKWYGSSVTRGARMRYDGFDAEAHKSRVKMAFAQGDSAHGEDGLNQVLAQRPVAVVGHVDDADASRMLPMYHKAAVLMFPLTAGSVDLIRDSQIYCVGYDELYYAHCLMELLIKAGLTRVAVVGDGTDHAGRLTDALVARMQHAGRQVDMVTQLMNDGELDDKVSKASQIGHPKGIVFISRDPARAAAMVNALAKTESRLPVVVTDGGASAGFTKAVGKVEFPVLVASAFDPTAARAKAFVDAYTKAHGEAPDQWAALAYDACGLFISSVEYCVGDERVEVYDVSRFERHIRGRIRPDQPYQGVTADIHFDEIGRAFARPVHLLQLDRGTFKLRPEKLSLEERTAIENAPPVQLTKVEDKPDGPGSGSGMGPGGPDPGGMMPRVKRPGERRLRWNTSIADALDEAEELDLPIFVDFFSKSCAPCLKMEKTTWKSAEFLAAAKEWVLLRIDLDADPAYASAYKLKGLPAFGFWSERGCVAKTVSSDYQDGKQMAALMDKHLHDVRQLTVLENRLLAPTHQAATMDDPTVYQKVAEFYYAKENWGEAASFYQTAYHMFVSAKKPKMARSLLARLCRSQVKALDIDGARRTAKEWYEAAPKAEGADYALYIWGYTLLRDKRADEARKVFETLGKQFGVDHKRYQAARKVYERYAGKALDGK